MVKCKWCGAEGHLEEFETHPDYPDVFWCPDCDGCTRLDGNDEQEVLLILENGGGGERAKMTAPLPALKKQLSPLRYPGGKSKMIGDIYARLGTEHISCFSEAFAGGASVGLSLLEAGVCDILRLNDADPGVYAFWHTVLNKPEALLHRIIQEPLPSHLTLWHSKEVLRANTTDTADLAWAQLVVNRLSYSGIAIAGAMGGKNGSQASLLARWNPETLAGRIRRIYDMRGRIHLTCMDGCEFIEEYGYWEKDGVLFVDPPYYEKGPQLYPLSFSEDDHCRLAGLLNDLSMQFPGVRVIITYDDHPAIRGLYHTGNIEVLMRKYSA